MVIGSDGIAMTSFPEGFEKPLCGERRDVIIAAVKQIIMTASFFMISFPFCS
jgi:hypothetical protein